MPFGGTALSSSSLAGLAVASSAQAGRCACDHAQLRACGSRRARSQAHGRSVDSDATCKSSADLEVPCKLGDRLAGIETIQHTLATTVSNPTPRTRAREGVHRSGSAPGAGELCVWGFPSRRGSRRVEEVHRLSTSAGASRRSAAWGGCRREEPCSTEDLSCRLPAQPR
jgi:hypothetical protein